MNELERLAQTLKASVSTYHCIMESEKQLKEAGFERLELGNPWELHRGKSYYVPIFDSSLMAFSIGIEKEGIPDLRMAASHTDWPCLKVKPTAEITTERYGKLNIEVYGGPILNTWIDRPLSMAGRVCITGADPFCPTTKLIDFKRPLAIIPNLAIHMNREVNEGVKLNVQIDMLPLTALLEEKLEYDHYFLKLLAQEAGCEPTDILDYEICLYNPEEGTELGFQKEFFSAPRLDNITSVQACLTGIIQGKRSKGINCIALYDNEEVGSRTKQGACSAVTERVLEKLYLSLGYGREDFLNAVMSGLLLSMDVAHGLHPNHTEKYDSKNKLLLGDGVAVKMAASQSYATDATAVSVIEGICRTCNIPYKKFANRSDMKGGSTLGTISSSLLSMRAVDVGVPILAMHSARELMGSRDQAALVTLASEFFRI